MKDLYTPTLRVTNIRRVTQNRTACLAAKVWVIHPNHGDFVFGGEFTAPIGTTDLLAAAKEWLTSFD